MRSDLTRGSAPKPAPPPTEEPPLEAPPAPFEEQEPPGPVEPAAQPPWEVEAFAQKARLRRRLSLLSLGLATIAALSFGLAVWRLEAGSTAPHGGAASRAPVLPRTGEGDSGPAPAPVPVPPRPPHASPSNSSPGASGRLAAVDPDDYTYDAPPGKRDAAFLTILSDVPASVTIDGMKVRKRTPLFRYPVQPGTRKIVLESLSTRERHAFELSFEKGKLRRVEERFRKPR
jgi:hypothetical protein